MKPIPFTKILGGLCCVAAVIYKYTETTRPQVSYWADLVFKCSAALGLWMARNHSTTDEQAVGVIKTDVARQETAFFAKQNATPKPPAPPAG
jgi:hypothetical protein